MGQYNVIEPGIVDGKHYTRPSKGPVEVDDAEAAPLVESGQLVAFEPVASVTDIEVVGESRRRGRRPADETPSEDPQPES